MINNIYIGSFHVNSTNVGKTSPVTTSDLLDFFTVSARVFEMKNMKISDVYSYWLLRYGSFCVSGVLRIILLIAGFIVDEHNANWCSINNVFGREGTDRTYSCEFHFKQSLTKHARKVSI